MAPTKSRLTKSRTPGKARGWPVRPPHGKEKYDAEPQDPSVRPPHDRSLLARGDCRRLVVSTAQALASGAN
jgi:hypothetical protein